MSKKYLLFFLFFLIFFGGIFFVFEINNFDGDDEIVYNSDVSRQEKYSVRLISLGKSPSDEYLIFISEHYNFIMTSVVSLVERIGELDYDNDFVYYNNPVFTRTWKEYPEEFYAHNENSTNFNKRIKSLAYGTYLMNISSKGWAEEFARDCAGIIEEYGTTYVFVDDCGPYILSRVDFVPDNYIDVETWKSDLGNLLNTTKNVIGDNAEVIFNGIYTNYEDDEREFLELVDGSVREGFVFDLNTREFLVEEDWKNLLNYIIEDTRDKKHLANFIYKGEEDCELSVDDRMFAFTSYLLINNKNLFYSIEDWCLVEGFDKTLVQYYPEMDLDFGEALEEYSNVEDYYDEEYGVYERNFGKGIVFVNPGEVDVVRKFDYDVYLVKPQGGGIVEDDGSFDGRIVLNSSNNLVVSSQSGAFVFYENFVLN